MDSEKLRLEIKSDMRDLKKDLNSGLKSAINDIRSEMINQRDANNADRRIIFSKFDSMDTKLDKIVDDIKKDNANTCKDVQELKSFKSKIIGMSIGASFMVTKFDAIANWLSKLLTK